MWTDRIDNIKARELLSYILLSYIFWTRISSDNNPFKLVHPLLTRRARHFLGLDFMVLLSARSTDDFLLKTKVDRERQIEEIIRYAYNIIITIFAGKNAL